MNTKHINYVFFLIHVYTLSLLASVYKAHLINAHYHHSSVEIVLTLQHRAIHDS